MPTKTKAELLAENERLQKRVAALERAEARSEAASKEIRQLRADLLQSEQHQTATANILRVISSSPTDTQPVFDAIAASAARLCDANDVVIRRVDGDVLRLAAHFGSVPVVRPTLRISRGSPAGRAILERRTIHVDDVVESRVRAEYPEAGPMLHLLIVPLLREDAALGTIVIRRSEAHPFTAKQVELLETFAAQAVIAIENVRLFNETREALEQQTATADILRVISGSPTDVQPVFDAVAESAARLCAAHDVVIRLVGADGHYAVAHHGPIPVLPPYVLTRANLAGRAIIDARTVHIPDITEAHVREEYPESPAGVQGVRTFLAVPLLREGKAIGLILMRRLEVRPFTDKQIQLLETFAAQAVIAIENVRLFKELQARNAELTESLEQQTVTSEILRIISSSPTDSQPVFDAIVKSGVHLFAGMNMTLRLVRGDHTEPVASTRPMSNEDRVAAPLNDDRSLGSRAMRSGEVMQIPDIAANDWQAGWIKERAARLGFRAIVSAPMMKEGVAIGVIHVSRAAPGLFTDREIALLKTFADQAVIAIENVRLFKELEARNAEITEALEQQTATSEILRVISSSPTDIQPVFDAILENATRLCDAHMATLRLYDGEYLRTIAQRGLTPEYAEWILTEGKKYGGSSEGWTRQMIAAKRPIHILDYREGATYRNGHPRAVAAVELGGVRTILAVPMKKEERLLGAIVVARPEVHVFTQKQIDLVSTFADQAVIAIENVRLFNETKEALERQTATADILKVISSSPTDTQPVFDAVAESAARLCGAYDVTIRLVGADGHHNVAHHGPIPATPPLVVTRTNMGGRAIIDARTVHIPDVSAAHVREEYPEIRASIGYRTFLAVPLLREGKAIGLIVMRRQEVHPFTDKQIQLLETFAAQAVIAIENVRLFHEIAEKGRQLEVASRHKSDFLASMSHELRTPLNAILGFIELILDQIYGEVPADLQEPLADIQASGKHLLRLINNVLDLAKIEAGRMELALTEYSVQDTVEGVRQTLRPLAADKGLEFLATVPPDLPFAHGDPGRITQCLMNLAGNSLKFTKAGKVEISVEQQGERLVFRVADTGIGIAPDKIDSLFTEFKQTDATIAGEYGGTGLGLSISRKFVEMHGGRIWVESELGRGSTFVFELPLRAGEPT